jgi:hypothetical protein
MPSLDFFATLDESIDIIREFCERGLSVHVEPSLPNEPSIPTFSGVDERLVSILANGPVFYLSGPFTAFPIQFVQLKEGPAAGKFMVNELAMGPVLKGRVGRISAVDNRRLLLPGGISYQRSYRNPETNGWERPSPALVASFKDCARTIRQHCHPYELKPGLTMLISSNALELLVAHEVVVDEEQVVPGGKG